LTRFPYIQMGADQTSLSPRLPIELRLNNQSVQVQALLDTGSTVNVIPYTVGTALGAVWENQRSQVRLAGNLSQVEARGLLVTGYLPEVTQEPFELVFAWASSPHVPILLGQINFFATFNVCFYRAEAAFEISARG
jgi:hypothetical protein